MLQVLDTENFDENVKEGIKFVAFTASWCGYCQKQKPILEDIAGQNIWIGEVDPDKNPQLVQRYAIAAFPSFLLFKDGKLIAKFAGYQSKYDLLNTILDYLK
ncbi:MAG: thioredoxin family protein [Candidatus Gastranaerophilales bacterium]|nr:thioredoxin family protein [Candidatus Gastranaerophilales bacterium]